MKVEDLTQPIWLLFDNFKKKQKVTYMHYIQVATKLSIKEKSLEDSYLFDGTNRVYKINKMIDLGNVNKPWKFEFFNPMRKIDLVLEEVSDSEILKRVLEVMKIQQEE